MRRPPSASIPDAYVEDGWLYYTSTWGGRFRLHLEGDEGRRYVQIEERTQSTPHVWRRAASGDAHDVAMNMLRTLLRRMTP